MDNINQLTAQYVNEYGDKLEDTSSAQLPYGNMGKQSRVSVKVPFLKHVFDASFGKIGLLDMPLSTYVTHEAVNKAICHEWSSRCHPTSTVTFPSPRHKIHVRYHASDMIHYSHDNCPRLESFFHYSCTIIYDLIPQRLQNRARH